MKRSICQRLSAGTALSLLATLLLLQPLACGIKPGVDGFGAGADIVLGAFAASAAPDATTTTLTAFAKADIDIFPRYGVMEVNVLTPGLAIFGDPFLQLVEGTPSGDHDLSAEVHFTVPRTKDAQVTITLFQIDYEDYLNLLTTYPGGIIEEYRDAFDLGANQVDLLFIKKAVLHVNTRCPGLDPGEDCSGNNPPPVNPPPVNPPPSGGGCNQACQAKPYMATSATYSLNAERLYVEILADGQDLGVLVDPLCHYYQTYSVEVVTTGGTVKAGVVSQGQGNIDLPTPESPLHINYNTGHTWIKIPAAALPGTIVSVSYKAVVRCDFGGPAIGWTETGAATP